MRSKAARERGRPSPSPSENKISVSAPKHRRPGTLKHLLFHFPVIQLGKAALAGFPEALVQVDAGFVHGPADHVIADVSGAREEVAQIAGVHGPHGGHGVALDAGNLHQAADGVTGQPQVVLHGHLRGVFHLVQVLAVELRQSGGGHGAGGADLRLTAALGPGDGGVAFGQVADDARGGKTPADGLVGEALGVLHVFKHRGNHAAGPAGGGGDDGAVVRVLLRHRIGVGGDLLEFPQGGGIAAAGFVIEIVGLPLDVQPPGQGAGGGQTVLNGLLHGLPHRQQKVPNLRPFVQLHIVAEGVDIAPLAEIRDLREGMLNINLFPLNILPAGNADVPAADGFHPEPTELAALFESDQVQGIGMGTGNHFLGENDLGRAGGQGLPQHPVRPVAHAGFAQRAIENDLKSIRFRVLLPKKPRSPLRPHGMGRTGTFADFINIPNGLHFDSSVFCSEVSIPEKQGKNNMPNDEREDGVL